MDLLNRTKYWEKKINKYTNFSFTGITTKYVKKKAIKHETIYNKHYARRHIQIEGVKINSSDLKKNLRKILRGPA